MSAGITINQSADLITATLANMPRGKWTDTYKLQSCPLLEAASGDGVRKQGGGSRWEFRIRLRENLTAKGVDLFEVNPTVRIKLMDKAYANWVHTDADMLYDARELLVNVTEKEQVIPWLQTQEAGQQESIANLWEENGWLCRISANDTKNFDGVAYWIRGLAAGQVDPIGGHNGVTTYYRNGAATTDYGGIDASLADNNRLRSWAATHSGMGIDLVNQLRVARRRVRFKAPPNMDGKGNTNSLAGFKVYFNQDMADEYERLVNQRGVEENTGDASYRNENFKIVGLNYEGVAALDSLSHQPVYGFSSRDFYMITLRGMWMHRGKPLPVGANPLIIQQKIFSSGNFFCQNPRGTFCIHRPR